MKEEAPRADEYLQHLVQLGSKRVRVTGLDREEGLDSEMHKSFRRWPWAPPAVDHPTLQGLSPTNNTLAHLPHTSAF